MKVEELIRRFRVLARDRAPPYLWPDEDVADWLTDAEAQACMRGRLIREDADPAVCTIALEEGKHTYRLHPAAYELISLRLLPAVGEPQPLRLVSREWLDAELQGWRTHSRPAGWAIQDDSTLRVVGDVRPGDVLSIECYRLPLKPLSASFVTREPEIHRMHHEHLIQWVLHKAFGIPDADAAAAALSAAAERQFTAYFGLLPDSDMRRITRTDVAHHNHSYLV